MMFLLALASQAISRNEICDSLAECPTVQEFGAEKSPARVEQMTENLTKRMWRLLPRTSDELRDALKEAFRQREEEKRNGAPESWRTRRMIGAQIWIDRFLFDPPLWDEHRKIFFSFAKIPADNYDNSSPTVPADIEDESARIYASLCHSSDPEPNAPDEFEYYFAHYPRRQLDLTPTNIEYLRLKSVIDCLDACPAMFSLEWEEADLDGRQRLFRKVETIMATMQNVSTETLRRAFVWFGRRERRMWKVIEETCPLKQYLEQFPLNSPRIKDERDQAYFKRLYGHAGDAQHVEFWVDRFLFRPPDYERVALLANNLYHGMNEPTNWNSFAGNKRVGELAPRMWPVQFQGGAFTFDDSKPFGEPGESFTYFSYEGREFAYFSSHYPRRPRW